MKKLLVICMGLLLLVGCSDTTNTPSKKVEDFLGKYQKQDDDVLTQLDLTLDSDTTMSEDQKKEYKSLLQKQYQNLSYKITDEKIEDDKATVEVEVEVFDYKTSMDKSKAYFEEHKDELMKDNKNDNKDDNADTNTNDNNDNNDDNNNDNNNIIDDAKAYIDYKISELKNVEDKTTYDITFNLTKKDGEWVVDDLSDADRQKLHGLY